MRDRAADLELAARLKSGDEAAVAELTALYEIGRAHV